MFDRADRESYWKKTRYWERFRENGHYYSEFSDKSEEFRKYSNMLSELEKQQREMVRPESTHHMRWGLLDTAVSQVISIQTYWKQSWTITSPQMFSIQLGP